MAIARTSQTRNILTEMAHPILALGGAGLLTLAFFIVLPVLQTITRPANSNLMLTSVESFQTEPPPPAPLEQEEPEPEPEPEEAPPELAEDAPLMDLSDIQLALNPGLASGIGNAADFAVKLNTLGSGGSETTEDMFSVGELDQKPRAISQPQKAVPNRLKRRLPASVTVVFIVDERGRVVDPKIRTSSDAEFNNLALATVKGWNWEPGKRGGQAIRYPVAQTITFQGAS